MNKKINGFYFKFTPFILKTTLFISIFSVPVVFAQNQENIQKAVNNIPNPCFISGCILFLVLVFFGYPFICKCKTNDKGASLKGLNLPQGSIRAMIAIAIIGFYLITLSVGSFFMEKETFNMVLTAFGSLSGAVIGFYFGSGGSGGKENKTLDQQQLKQTSQIKPKNNNNDN